MGWERRVRGGRYDTCSRKVNGRVVREYVGGGLAGELAAGTDAQVRGERATDVHAWREERARIATADAALMDLCELTEVLVHGALLVAGYHQHHRGDWRRSRGRNTRDRGDDSGRG